MDKKYISRWRNQILTYSSYGLDGNELPHYHMLCCRDDNIPLVEELAKTINPDEFNLLTTVKSKIDYTCLHVACCHGASKMLKWLFNNVDGIEQYIEARLDSNKPPN